MPGAGGLRAANWLYNVAAKDGTVVSVLAPETALKPIFGDAAASYEPAKFTWIGNMDESIATCTVSARSGITSVEQLFTREAVFGATGSAAPTSKFAYALVNFLGAKIKVVQGYKGSNDLRIALNRGEIEGACGPSHSTLKTQWKDDIDSGRIRVLVQFGLKKLADLQGRRAHLRLCEVEGGSRGLRRRLRPACARPAGDRAARRAGRSRRRAARRVHARPCRMPSCWPRRPSSGLRSGRRPAPRSRRWSPASRRSRRA